MPKSTLNRWAIAHRKSLEEIAPERLETLKKSGQLTTYLREVGVRAERQYEEVVAHLTNQAAKDKTLPTTYLERWQALKAIASRAEEVVMEELLVRE